MKCLWATVFKAPHAAKSMFKLKLRDSINNNNIYYNAHFKLMINYIINYSSYIKSEGEKCQLKNDGVPAFSGNSN